ncbi:type II toxin-antitoxin system Phd/YefM family antitoxin [Frankia sp. CiP3]|uniref:type II toxin-antitoxin system Phd/YefM family antitoxin n=1 Tax=Frankia sp. CiP3 TaxID=2880971 RepID=UPI001EF58D27|nr:type II toxin-antitoxin system prevent-host-death family antitoxin [Frankia sp. CiP3]
MTRHDQVTVTRNGRPAAVVVSVEERESPHETLAILADTDMVAAIREAREQVAGGEVYPTEEVVAASRRRGQRSA